MQHAYRYVLALGSLGLIAAAAAACSHDLMMTAAAGAVPTSVTLRSSAASLLAAAAADSTLWKADSDEGRGHGPMFFGRIRKADIDSLTVDVAKVEVLAATADTENAADSAAEAKADSGRRGNDDDRGDHENDERTWVSLDVTAGGHLNLLMLPDSAKDGITVATGTLAAGTYKHVRLFVTDAMIFLKNQIVTPTGDTLKAGVGLAVKIPSADSTGAAIKTDERFTVTSGSATVQLFFDGDDTIRHVVVTGDGTIIVPPVIH